MQFGVVMPGMTLFRQFAGSLGGSRGLAKPSAEREKATQRTAAMVRRGAHGCVSTPIYGGGE